MRPERDNFPVKGEMRLNHHQEEEKEKAAILPLCLDKETLNGPRETIRN